MNFGKYFSKDRFSLRQVVGMLTVVIIGGGVLAYATTVTIPNTFVSGTTAKASDVNANFTALADAINNRASASLANVAGTWNYTLNGSFIEALSGNTLCTMSRTGTLTLNADGTFSDSQANTNNYCQGAGVQVNTGGTMTGTWTVSSNGSGTLTYSSGGLVSLQSSKDLNTMTSVMNVPTGNYPGNWTITYLRQ